LGAVSADHLVKTSEADVAALARSNTVAVSLPCTPFGLAESAYTPAQQILAADGLLALATDCNPGTAWCESMQFVIALACRVLKLTPAQAIAAATINAAQAIQRADQIGSIEPGKQADLLVLSVPDYRQLGYRFGTNLVKQVVKRGRVYQVERAFPPRRWIMSIDIVQLAPYFWIAVVVLAIVVAFVVIRFFWHHILRYIMHGCLGIVGILALLALLHFIFKLF